MRQGAMREGAGTGGAGTGGTGKGGAGARFEEEAEKRWATSRSGC